MADVINQIRPYNGMMVFASENAIVDGLFACRLDKDIESDTDFIELVDDTASLSL